jgi:transposase
MQKTYTKEFKIQICKLVIDDGLKPSVVAENFNINSVMLYRWIDEYRTFGNEAFVGKGYLKPEDAEMKRLQKENDLLKQENEILKKAAAYFAKENRKN